LHRRRGLAGFDFEGRRLADRPPPAPLGVLFDGLLGVVDAFQFERGPFGVDVDIALMEDGALRGIYTPQEFLKAPDDFVKLYVDAFRASQQTLQL